VQNNYAERSINITDNALNVTNANGHENIKKTERQAQPSVSQVNNEHTTACCHCTSVAKTQEIHRLLYLLSEHPSYLSENTVNYNCDSHGT